MNIDIDKIRRARDLLEDATKDVQHTRIMSNEGFECILKEYKSKHNLSDEIVKKIRCTVIKDTIEYGMDVNRVRVVKRNEDED